MRETMRNAREALHLTQTQAAERAGISKSYWCYIESGERAPTLDVAGRIGAVLGTNPSVLFDELKPEGGSTDDGKEAGAPAS